MHLGQEIYLFFYRFGINGIFGIVLCNIIMSFAIYKTLKIAFNENIYTYSEFLNIILPKQNNKFLNLNNIINIIINIFLLITFFIMISGFGAFFSQEFGFNKIFGSSILASICYLAFLGNIEKITKINRLVIPLLISIIIIVGIKNILNIDLIQIDIKKEYTLTWLLQAIVYTSYNLILLTPVLINLIKFIKNTKQIKILSIISGIILCSISLLMFFLLVNVDIDFSNLEMPIVYVVKNKFPSICSLYEITILIAIFTTAITLGISFLNNVSKDKKIILTVAKIMCIGSLMVCNIGFSNLVKVLFPIFGYLGLILMFFIFIKWNTSIFNLWLKNNLLQFILKSKI